MSTPHINPNDPKWTAYVLGELDEADRASVERLLESFPEARAFVDELKRASSALAEALASESPDVLGAAQRAAIRTAADAGRAPWLTRLPMQWRWGSGAVAAAVIVAAVVWLPGESPAPASRTGDDVVLSSSGAAAPAVPAADAGAGPADRQAGASTPPPAPAATAAAMPAPVAQELRVNAGAAASTMPGVARDASGGVLPGVTVTATDPASGAVVTGITDSTGRYTLGNVMPGQVYRLTATLPGFNPVSTDLQASRNEQRDFEMRVGSLAETISVSVSRPVVDVQSTARQVTLNDALARESAAGGGRGVGAGRAFVPGGVAGGVVGPMPVPAPPAAVASAPQPVASPAFSGVNLDVERARRVVSPGTESYASVAENTFIRASQEPLATFSIDVDTASYSNVRRFLSQNQLPPGDAVRIEELVNYFTYDYARPSGPHPIGASMEVADAPWNPRHRLVRVGIKARDIDANKRPASNLVFLIDVSGSMNTPQKLPLVKSSLKLLVDQLGENDMVSMVVYAGSSGLVLPPTGGNRKSVIARAIDDLQAGGSTNGGAGIQLAYRQAMDSFIRGGVNRVILVTDGDFNVGITSQGELTRLIEDRARSGVFLSVLGYGMGNLKDSTMERLANQGNGHYAYIDTLNEARKVLVEEMSNTLVTVAKDVKIQVDFNPAKVEAYRLVGYENRMLQAQDFNDDLKDAGEMGAGHAVTALFEIVPRGGTVPGSIDPSVFQPAPRETPRPASTSNDLLVLRVRYKLPDASESTRMDVPLPDRRRSFAEATADFRFAASVAAFGMILKNSQYRGEATLPWVMDTAEGSRGADRGGYRAEFVSLVQRAVSLRSGEFRR
jgi:Ca-activated chloride channel family protein